MKVLGIASQKGGVGKTTLSMNLAIAAAMDGMPSVIIDMDGQKSNRDTYYAIRQENENGEQPMVIAADIHSLPDVLIAAANDGYGLAIIDTPPKAGDMEVEAATKADVVLVPTKLSRLDLAAIAPTIELAKKKRDNALGFAVLSQGHPMAKARHQDATDFITQNYEFPVCPVWVTHRASYQYAVDVGQGVLEFEPYGEAAREIKKLWDFVREALTTAEKNRSASTTRKAVANG